MKMVEAAGHSAKPEQSVKSGSSGFRKAATTMAPDQTRPKLLKAGYPAAGICATLGEDQVREIGCRLCFDFTLLQVWFPDTLPTKRLPRRRFYPRVIQKKISLYVVTLSDVFCHFMCER